MLFRSRWKIRTVADASVAFLEDGEGEGDSAKSEMMVASSVKLRLRGRWGFVIRWLITAAL